MLEIIQTLGILFIAAVVIYKLKPIEATRGGKKHAVIIDSCALIDGRVVELAQAGFLPANILVPQFIVAELQLLADGSDSHKRERARYGLEVVQLLQQDPKLTVNIARQPIQARTTDEKLVKLAKKIGADLFTTDFNLNQVANIEGVRVLNINELSHAMRPVALPGEAFEVKVVQAGSNRDQGVGYLEDGTMIVIDGARRDIGHSVSVKVTRTHQTVAGKMIFAVKVAGNTSPDPKPSPKAEVRTKVAATARPKRAQPTTKPPQTQRQSRPQQNYRQSPKAVAEASLLDAINTHGE